MADAQKPFVQYVHPEYAAREKEWQFADDHYTGNLLREDRIKNYLIRKGSGEKAAAYDERIKRVDFRPHFAAIADSLAGMATANADDANMVWYDEATGFGLGDHTKKGTISNRLLQNADGRGTGWLTLRRQGAVLLSTMHKYWGIVDTQGDPDKGTARGTYRIVSPLGVTNWFDQDGRLVGLCVPEQRDVRTSIRDEPKLITTYLLYGIGEWQRYKVEDNVLIEMSGPGDRGVYDYVDYDRMPCVPAFSVDLSLERNVGYQVARGCNALFNQQSELDALLSNAHHPLLKLVGTDKVAAAIAAQLAEGNRAIQDDPTHTKSHAFETPDVAPADVMMKLLEKKVQDLYISAMKSYGDAAKERTATEARIDLASGVASFLHALVTTQEDAENYALWLLAQAFLKKSPNNWGVAKVTLSRDFVPADINASIDNLIRRATGDSTGAVPMGPTAQKAAIKQAVEWLGLPAVDAEIDSAIRLTNVSKALDVGRELWPTLPAEAKAHITMQYLEGIGLLTPEGNVVTRTGKNGATEKKTAVRDAWLAEATELAAKQNEGALGPEPPALPTDPTGLPQQDPNAQDDPTTDPALTGAE